jgi:pyruvate dehydrogenase E2 component (dihydrolipoamide acetyltransferase)
MPTFDFKLPDIGEGVMEGEIVSWLVEPGEAVTEDQPMVEVMTDKATVTIGAPKTGSILALEAEVGEVVPVGNVIVRLDVGGGAAAAPEAPVAEPEPAPVAEPEPAVAAPKPAVAPASAQEGPAATAVGDIRETLPGAAFFEEAAPAPAPPVGGHFDPRPRATPATRKLARDLGVDLHRVPPTGTGGRIAKADVTASPREDGRGARRRRGSRSTSPPRSPRRRVEPPSPRPHASPSPSRRPASRRRRARSGSPSSASAGRSPSACSG